MPAQSHLPVTTILRYQIPGVAAEEFQVTRAPPGRAVVGRSLAAPDQPLREHSIQEPEFGRASELDSSSVISFNGPGAQ